MKLFVKLLTAGMVLMVFQMLTFAQPVSTAVPDLMIAPDSRAGAMGESGVGLANNSSAIYWNPAGIAFLDGQEVSITHSNWLPQFQLDLFYDYFTYRIFIPEINGSLFSSIMYMNFGQFVRTSEAGPTSIGTFNSYDAAITFGYATQLSSDWGIGVNFRIIRSVLSSQGAGEEQGSGIANSVSFDLAAMWRPETLVLPLVDYDLGKSISFGVNLSNMGPKIYYIDQAQSDPIPTNLRIGFAYQLINDEYNSCIFTCDFNKLMVSDYTTSDSTTVSRQFYQSLFTSWSASSLNNELQSIQTSMGIEYWYGKPGDFLFAIRAGYFYEDPSWGDRKFISFGAGIRYDIYGFDFSYLTTSIFPGYESPLDNTLRFTLNIGWGGNSANERNLPRGI
jgi:hypothetical protein